MIFFLCQEKSFLDQSNLFWKYLFIRDYMYSEDSDVSAGGTKLMPSHVCNHYESIIILSHIKLH
jgi:hypothetical protein